MDTLREFLLDRVTEDENLAQLAIDAHEPGGRRGLGDPVGDAYLEHWSPWRVMSGCVAKRLIITTHRDAGPETGVDAGESLDVHVCATCSEDDGTAAAWPCYTLRVLALDYVDHPDYRWEWRPDRVRCGRY